MDDIAHEAMRFQEDYDRLGAKAEADGNFIELSAEISNIPNHHPEATLTYIASAPSRVEAEALLARAITSTWKDSEEDT